MHYSEIDHEAKIGNADADLEESIYGDRPILLDGLAAVDGCDILVPADSRNPESTIVALTAEQGAQALLVLASQIGKSEALLMIEELL
jgi:hypothetical protein